MMDFVIKMVNKNGRPRFVLETDPLKITYVAILETAVIVALFTDRQADSDDVIPDGTNDKRGWWGDALASVSGDLIGSRLWLLQREKQTEPVRKAAEDYADEALQHLIDDEVVDSVQVTASYPRAEWLALDIDIETADGQLLNFNYAWEAFNGV
ncbi:phage GP46 family protein [Methylophaga thiooxydans]|uniref:Phage protein GP46 n=1 Tax=Methylophaga thiooxydans DMS010 TaxID=637616 RepID=C0N2F2_9GAMM|nr:phage GP46 family protein [Methylophaga thiooxydans]EEF78401.1 phage protein GP46 [Methylophaga thiooxydans DMS010]EEF78818.1 phage protein GP46 [Methylophaga thiooxydans DMS010]EEF78912.1 phage protein GP46 [Methylophaga thiooxydans DMS010]EEF79074.1 phage protein GP46 [Methylophaga thiooxydans DMS010]EEF79753.1 phage protein GP46 [Methylophaga thiooxydans DMS010]